MLIILKFSFVYEINKKFYNEHLRFNTNGLTTTFNHKKTPNFNRLKIIS